MTPDKEGAAAEVEQRALGEDDLVHHRLDEKGAGDVRGARGTPSSNARASSGA